MAKLITPNIKKRMFNKKWALNKNGRLIKNGRLTVSGNLKTVAECQSAVDETHRTLNKRLKKPERKQALHKEGHLTTCIYCTIGHILLLIITFHLNNAYSFSISLVQSQSLKVCHCSNLSGCKCFVGVVRMTRWPLCTS